CRFRRPDSQERETAVGRTLIRTRVELQSRTASDVVVYTGVRPARRDVGQPFDDLSALRSQVDRLATPVRCVDASLDDVETGFSEAIELAERHDVPAYG